MDTSQAAKSAYEIDDLAARIEDIYGNLNSKLVTCIAKLDWMIDQYEFENPEVDE